MVPGDEIIMLGEKLGEFRGKTMGQRVLPAAEGRPALETSSGLVNIRPGVRHEAVPIGHPDVG